MVKRTTKKKATPKRAAALAVATTPAAKAALKEAKADFREAKQKETASRKAVGVAQRECIDQHPNAKDAGAKYRAAVSAHVKAINVRAKAGDRVIRLTP